MYSLKRSREGIRQGKLVKHNGSSEGNGYRQQRPKNKLPILQKPKTSGNESSGVQSKSPVSSCGPLQADDDGEKNQKTVIGVREEKQFADIKQGVRQGSPLSF